MTSPRPLALIIITIIIIGLAAVPACVQPPPSPPPPPMQTTPATESYVPGLGEMMTLQQMRHTKLWLAGQALNWDLVTYEVEELGEGFDDVVKYHPTHKDAPVAPKDAIPRMITEPLAQLRSLAKNKDAAAFPPAYDALTDACNNCHKAMDFSFNIVGRPTGNPFTNQIFQPQPSAASQ
jgi:hypothetical protein